MAKLDGGISDAVAIRALVANVSLISGIGMGQGVVEEHQENILECASGAA